MWEAIAHLEQAEEMNEKVMSFFPGDKAAMDEALNIIFEARRSGGAMVTRAEDSRW